MYACKNNTREYTCTNMYACKNNTHEYTCTNMYACENNTREHTCTNMYACKNNTREYTCTNMYACKTKTAKIVMCKQLTKIRATIMKFKKAILNFHYLKYCICNLLKTYYLYWISKDTTSTRRVWIFQKGNQNPYIARRTDNTMAKRQTTQWTKEKVEKDKQRSTKYTYITKDRVTRTPLKSGGKFRGSGRVGSSCFTSFPNKTYWPVSH